MTSVSKETGAAILKRLDFLYDQRAADLLTKIEQLLEKHREKIPEHAAAYSENQLWDESTVVLITYGDQIQDATTRHRHVCVECAYCVCRCIKCTR